MLLGIYPFVFRNLVLLVYIKTWVVKGEKSYE